MGQLLRAFAGVILLVLGSAAGAATLSFQFNFVFSGIAPVGSTPWASAVFTDVGTNLVRLELDAGGLTGPENVKQAYFNLDPALDPASLTIGFVQGDPGTQATNISMGANQFMADGDGKFDLLFNFSPGSGFDAGESAVYELSYAGSGVVSAASFDFLSASAGGHGPFLAALQVQNTGGGGESAWIAPVAMPLPAPMALLAGGLLALLGAPRTRGRL